MIVETGLFIAFFLPYLAGMVLLIKGMVDLEKILMASGVFFIFVSTIILIGLNSLWLTNQT